MKSKPKAKHYSSSDIMGVLLDVQSTLKTLADTGSSSVKEEDDPKFVVC